MSKGTFGRGRIETPWAVIDWWGDAGFAQAHVKFREQPDWLLFARQMKERAA